MTTSDKIKTAKDKLIQAEADHARNLRQIEIEENLFNLTGLDFNCYDHGKSISVWIENNQWKNNNWDRAQLAEYYKKLCTIYKPVNFVQTYAGREETKTVSPMHIKFNNSINEGCKSHPQTIEFCFSFEGNIKVSFKMLCRDKPFIDDLMRGTTIQIDRYSRAKHPEMKTAYGLPGFYTVNWNGHDKTILCTDKEKAKRFEKIILTGKE